MSLSEFPSRAATPENPRKTGKTRLTKLLLPVWLLGFCLALAWLWLFQPVWTQYPESQVEERRTAANSVSQSTPILFQMRGHRVTVGESSVEPANEPAASENAEIQDEFDQLRHWARQNPAEAQAWVATAPPGPHRDAVVEIVCAQLAQSHPQEAVTLAERFNAGSYLLENLVQQWAEQDWTAAYTYAAGKPPAEERDRLLMRLAFVRSKENPADAAIIVVEQISPGEIQNEAAISVLHQWFLKAPEAARAWAQLFPPGDLRDRALKEVDPLAPGLPESKLDGALSPSNSHGF